MWMSANFFSFVTFSYICGSFMLRIDRYREDVHTFWANRNKTLVSEDHMRLGGSIVLNPAEIKVNQFLMTAKEKEIQQGETSGSYPPSRHFFFAKDAIEKSQVFQVIKKMPKGGALHLHDTSMTSVRWLVNATYADNCFMCFQSGKPRFQFFDKPRIEPKCDQDWKPANWYRKYLYNNATYFDEMLFMNMTMISDDPYKAYPTQAALWNKFYECFNIENGIINYAPVFRAYYYQALQEFYNDNVQYIESRALLPPIYELNGTLHDKEFVLNLYQEITSDFVRKHPDFTGARLIHSSLRHVDKSIVLQDIKDSIKFRQKFPDFFAGFDLVGREDSGYPLIHFIDELLYPSQQTPPVYLPYYFHAGETDWEGTDIDDNLIDALLLNTSRIGHGYALPKHPVAMTMVRDRSVAIEVNPISNQVLHLVEDLRNHPSAVLFSQNFPVVISSDDPALWGALPLSHDFYEAFMGLAGREGDLSTLKQLAINSIKYSAMSSGEKTKAMNMWLNKWHQFIDDIITKYTL